MFGFRYLKTPPTTYVLHYSGGKLRHEGPGLSFFYFGPSSSIVRVPMASSGVPFAFQDTTADFQTVTLQGQLIYRVADPKKLASMLDYSTNPEGKYISDDYQKPAERLVQLAQAMVRTDLQRLTLKQALTAGDGLAAKVATAIKEAEPVKQLGIEILDLTILAVRCTPDMAKALEAEAREDLNRRSDEAIYQRRNAAVEQERRIKESELNTQLAVEEKQRQIREKQIETEISIEQQKVQLTDQRVANQRKEADASAYGLNAMIEPLRGLDWRTVMMLSQKGAHPQAAIALAFQEMAANAQKIGELNMTPDLLRSLTRNRDE